MAAKKPTKGGPAGGKPSTTQHPFTGRGVSYGHPVSATGGKGSSSGSGPGLGLGGSSGVPGAASGGPLAGLPPGLKDGIPTPAVDPFLTPEQMGALSEAIKNYNLQMEDISYNLGTQRGDTAFQKGQSDKNAIAATSGANDEAIRRGIFQSSIRDGDLADIQGTNATAKGRLDDLLSAAVIHADTQQRNLTGALQALQDSFDKQAVANAQDAGKDQNPWLLEPQKPGKAITGEPTPNAGGSKPSGGSAAGPTATGGKVQSDATGTGPGLGLPRGGPAGGRTNAPSGSAPPKSPVAATHKVVAGGVVRAWTPQRAAVRHR